MIKITDASCVIQPQTFSNNTQKPKEKEKEPSEKSTMSNAKNVMIGATALASVVIAGIATKGRLWGKGSNINKNLINNVINDFKTNNVYFKDTKPIVTKLKNGKQKIEFIKCAKNNLTELKHMIILDKSGKFEKMIVFEKFLNGNYSQYNIFDGMVGYNSNFIKSFQRSTKSQNGNKKITTIHLEKPFEKGKKWEKEIVIKSNDEVVNVINDGYGVKYADGIPPEQSIHTIIFKNSNGPHDVRQSIFKLDNSGINYAYNNTKNKVVVDDAFSGLTEEQSAAFSKLHNISNKVEK